ncbi:MAG: hypothetical protein MMC23_000159 [Stictis urceolatum]|nr:hypothetical protein [Stictis urceolata]
MQLLLAAAPGLRETERRMVLYRNMARARADSKGVIARYRSTRSLYSLAPSHAYGFWHEQVMESSKLRLSYPRDKLPAPAGVASKIHGLTGSDRIAGLWRQNLIKICSGTRHIFEALGWYASPIWRAPAFSWASIRGNVFYGEVGSASRSG